MANNLKTLTADIVANHIGHNKVSAGDLPTLITSVYQALSTAAAPTAPAQAPAVPIRSSVKPGYIVSLEDGRKLKTLKKHLMAIHGMTPDDYRRKWGLPDDYPMVAPNYAQVRSAMAKANGLGKLGSRPKATASPARAANTVNAKATPKKRRTKPAS